MNVFSHSGDIGDLIAHLPIIKANGGGKLVLFVSASTGFRMTKQRADSLRPLLERQPYIESVEWKDSPEGMNLDNWRRNYKNNLNLTDMACDCFGLPHPDRQEPWLAVEPNPIAKVVIARSPRYRNKSFPWHTIYESLPLNDCVFVGHPDEHADFSHHYGPISYRYTPDMYELARVIAGCRLFVGNQSSPLWVAEALKKPLCLEVDHRCENCHWQRPTAHYYWGSVLLDYLKQDVVVLP